MIEYSQFITIHKNRDTVQNSDIFYFNKIITHLNMSMVKTYDKNIFQSRE